MLGGTLEKLYSNAGETSKPEESGIEGNVPSWVNGTYLKTGPGKFHFDNNFSLNHYFDGYANVSRFEIQDGRRVIFEKKYLDTDAHRRACAAQKPMIVEFGTGAYPDMSKSFLFRCIPTIIPEMSDNHNMALFNIGTNVCVAGESCFFRDLDHKTLELGDKHDTNKCYGLNFTSPHPLTDDTGTTYTIGSSFLTGLKYNFVRIPSADSGKPRSKEMLKKSKVIASISTQCASMISMHHSFGMTKNHIVFIEQPYVLNVTKILGSVLSKGQCFFDWLEWRPELKNKFYFIDKRTGKVVKTEVSSVTPFMFMHLINCYEDEATGQVAIDLMLFDNGDFMGAQFIEKILTGGPFPDSEYGSAARFIVPLLDNFSSVEEGVQLVDKSWKSSASAIRKGKEIFVKPEIWTERGCELPCINKRFVGKKYQFAFCTGNTSPGHFENALCRINVDTGEQKIWRDTHNLYPGEMAFIPNPNGNEEDEADGVLVSVVIDSRHEGTDFLLFLDAKTFEEIGRAKFKNKLPFLIHGIFVP